MRRQDFFIYISYIYDFYQTPFMGMINIFDFTRLFTKKSLHESGVALDFFAKVKLKVDGMCHIPAAKLSKIVFI